MAQHFLLSKEARTLSLANVVRPSDDEAPKRMASRQQFVPAKITRDCLFFNKIWSGRRATTN